MWRLRLVSPRSLVREDGGCAEGGGGIPSRGPYSLDTYSCNLPGEGGLIVLLQRASN